MAQAPVRPTRRLNTSSTAAANQEVRARSVRQKQRLAER
jgi:hypothetical protein